MNVQQLIKELGIEMFVGPAEDNPLIDPNPRLRARMRHFKVILRSKERGTGMRLLFSVGEGKTRPTLEDVLQALATDAALVENDEIPLTGDEEYDTEVATAVKAQTSDLQNFLGGWYEPFIYGGRE